MPNPRKPSPASVRIASEAFSVPMTGSDCDTFEKMCLKMILGVRAPTTRAEST
jgi:hypothetical protein